MEEILEASVNQDKYSVLLKYKSEANLKKVEKSIKIGIPNVGEKTHLIKKAILTLALLLVSSLVINNYFKSKL